MPFYGRKRQHIVEQIMKGAYEFKGRRWKRVSPQAKDFVESLLQVDPEERHSADEALGHVWLNRRHAATVRNPMQHEEESAHESLLKFANYSKLKKVALMVIAHKSTSEEIGILRKVFQKYDTKKDGVLSYEEFKAGFEAAGLAEDDCRKIFDACDLDGSGKIRYTEFLAATIEAHGAITEEKLAEAFDRLDSDDSGFISAANLREILGDEITDEQIDAIIKEADLTKDGKISYTEFLALWEDQHENFRESVFQDLAVIDAATDVSASFDSVDPTEIKADTDEIVSRANFIEQKKEAVRRFSGEFKDMSSEVFLDGDLALAAAAAASQANDGGNGLSPPAFSADV